NLAPNSVADHIRELSFHAFANLRPQRFDSTFFDPEAAAEFLVDSRQRLLLHRLYDEREVGCFACKCFVGKLGRERHGDRTALARHRALQSLLELRPRLARANDDRDVLAVPTLEGLAADASGVVHSDPVGLARGAI